MAAFAGILPYGRLLTNRVTIKSDKSSILDEIKTNILLKRLKIEDVTQESFEDLMDWERFCAWKK